MIIGIGTDIVSVKRIEKVLFKRANFAQRILTDKELLFFYERNSSPFFLAGRFAAKEAIMKAIGTGLSHGIRFKDIEINYKNKSPIVILKGNALSRFNSLQGNKIFISISHEKDYAVSFVVIEK